MWANLISIRVGSINPPFHMKIEFNIDFLMEPQYENKWRTRQNLGANKAFKLYSKRVPTWRGGGGEAR